MGDLKATALLARMDRWRHYAMADLDAMLEYESREVRINQMDGLEDLTVYHEARVDAIRAEIRRRNRVPAGHLAKGRLGMFTAEIVKDTVPIEKYIGQHVELRKCGQGRYLGLCPMRPEKTPSFTVYEGRGFYCFSCSWGGDIFDFAMQAVLKNTDFIAAVQEVAVWAGMMTRGVPSRPAPGQGKEALAAHGSASAAAPRASSGPDAPVEVDI